jgi:hypothetical protein
VSITRFERTRIMADLSPAEIVIVWGFDPAFTLPVGSRYGRERMRAAREILHAMRGEAGLVDPKSLPAVDRAPSPPRVPGPVGGERGASVPGSVVGDAKGAGRRVSA